LPTQLAATSLGDIYTWVTYPPISSHRDLSPEQRQAQGISDGILRLSVGIEDADDIIADLAQAFEPTALTPTLNAVEYSS
jgi:cystathionine beta-lyase/cystathionine gamma-synthase